METPTVTRICNGILIGIGFNTLEFNDLSNFSFCLLNYLVTPTVTGSQWRTSEELACLRLSGHWHF